jgi:hypothetical protein
MNPKSRKRRLNQQDEICPFWDAGNELILSPNDLMREGIAAIMPPRDLLTGTAGAKSIK